MLAVHLASFFFTKLQEDPTTKVDRFLHAMRLNDEQLNEISAHLYAEMKKGLSKESNATADVKMFPTHVRSITDGSEKGEFLALDLGGSRFKVLQVKVREGSGIRRGEVDIVEKVYPLPDELLSGKGVELFDHVSACLKDFMQEKNISFEKKHALAFTFGFSCEQHALNHGILQEWSKNFKARGLEKKDVVETLRQSIDRIGGMDIEILALVNDTVATMMTCGFDDHHCEIGLIVGTGTNACYMEDMSHVDLVEGDEGRMCVNTEWGSLGDDGSLDLYITQFDKEVDAASVNPGKHIFEKMISGLYLGELVRLIVLKMAKLGLIFDGCVSNALRTKGMITTAHVAAMEEYKTGLKNTKDILRSLDINPTPDDCVAVQHVSTIVSFRSSNLVAAGLTAILTRMRQNRHLRELRVSVGVDGTVYKIHPQYPKRLHKVVRQLLPDCHIRFILSDKGSSKGAALVAAVAQRLVIQKQQVNEILSKFELTVEQLQQVKYRMREAMEEGLNTTGPSAMKMLPSFVYQIPDGTESGKYLALDLGKTTFRAMLVKFETNTQTSPRLYHKIYTIPLEIMQGTGEELFDQLAEYIGDFLDYMGMKNVCLPTGFTFSFPCKQTSINTGTLVTWTKGFKATNCEGNDVVMMLREAIKRRNEYDLDIVALINDTVGTMMSCAYEYPQCEIGLIAGTGTNVCYMEERSNIKKLKINQDDMEKGAGPLRMCINTEWGGMGDDGSLDDIITYYDTEVDEHSVNPGKQRFEKLISGMYIGELVREVLLELTTRGLLFKGHVTEALKTPGSFETKYVSQIESDRLALLQVRVILLQLGFDSTCDDSIIVKEVCGAISGRGAKLCGAGMASVVDKIRDSRRLASLKITVGVEGALYKGHPHFSRIIMETTQLLAPQCDVTFLPTEEGSGKGAALTAAVARRQK